MSKVYTVPFDSDASKYKTVDVTAVLKHLQQGEYVEVDTGDVTCRPKRENLLTFAARGEGVHTVIEVGVEPEAPKRADFEEQIKEPIEVRFSVKPKPAQGGAAPAEVSTTGSVRIAPMPYRVKVLQPEASAFPWPALAERVMSLELQLLKPFGNAPAPNVRVGLRRKTQSKPKAGSFAPEAAPPQMTDPDGRVCFSYVPATLEYEPSGVYFEQYQVLAGPEGEEQELELIELPLSPAYKLQPEVRKECKIAGKDGGVVPFGLCGPEELLTVEIPAEAQATSFKGLIEVPPPILTASGTAEPFPVAAAFWNPHLWNGESFVPLFQPIERCTIVTGPKGEFLWEPPGLKREYRGRRFEPYVLTRDCQQLPLVGCDPDAEKVIAEYERMYAFLEPNYGGRVLSESLAKELAHHRSRYLERLASRPPDSFPRLRSFTRLLGHSAAYAERYRKLVGELAGSFPEKITQLFNDIAGVAFSVLTYGDNVEEVVRSLRDRLMAKEWAQAAAEVGGSVAHALGTAASVFFEYVVQPLVNGFVRLLRALLQAIERGLGWVTKWLGEAFGNTLRGVRDALVDIYARLDGFLGIGECHTVDAICNWFFKVCEGAWLAFKAVVQTIALVISGGLCLALRASRFVLANCGLDWDALLGPKNLEILKRIMGEGPEGWGGGLREAVELFIQTKVQQLFDAAWIKSAEGGVGGLLRSVSLLPVDLLVNLRLSHVDGLLADAHAFVPLNDEERIAVFRDRTNNVSNASYRWERESAEMDEALAWMELILNLAIGVIMAFGSVLKALVSTLKIGATSILRKLDALQIAMSALKAGKTLLWDVVGSVGLALWVFFTYFGASSDLVSEGA